jgi:hypothetical protein
LEDYKLEALKIIIKRSPFDTTVFRNLVGFLNSDTLNSYPLWKPNQWSSKINPDIEYGSGSMLFNINSETNTILDIQLRNLRFEKMFQNVAYIRKINSSQLFLHHTIT